MTRPADIPQGVWERAEKAMGAPNVYAGKLSHLLLTERCARAILAATEAERERCAGIADQYVWDSNALDHAPPIGLACHHQSLEIAAAIRKATP